MRRARRRLGKQARRRLLGHYTGRLTRGYVRGGTILVGRHRPLTRRNETQSQAAPMAKFARRHGARVRVKDSAYCMTWPEGWRLCTDPACRTCRRVAQGGTR